MQEHPSEIELLELVEGDLDETERAAVEAHVAGCASCASAVGELERTRELLRAAPLLELPPQRRAAIFDNLPPQERERTGLRGFFSSPKRIALVAVPVAAVAVAAVVTISLTRGGGTQTAADASRTAKTSGSAFAEAQTRAGGVGATTPSPNTPAPAQAPTVQEAPAQTGGVETTPSTPTTIHALGAATDVAVQLERAGVHVDRVLDRKVIVTADPAAVREALDGRVAAPDQPGVDVVVQPPSP